MGAKRKCNVAVGGESPPTANQYECKEVLDSFLRIADDFRLSTDEQLIVLGKPARSTLFAWKVRRHLSLSADTTERIAYIQAIHENATKLAQKQDITVDEYIRKKGTFKEDVSILETMLDGLVVNLFQVATATKFDLT